MPATRTALGEATTFHFEYGLDSQYGLKTTPSSGGIQITPRSSFGHLTDLKPDTTYHFRLVATNAAGTTLGADATFKTTILP